MSEDYTPSMDDIAEYYTACRMRGYDEVQGGEPYAIVRALLPEGADLNREVRDEIYRQLSGHYGDFAVPTPKEAQAVIDAMAGHLLNAVPDDSADDVREALGL